MSLHFDVLFCIATSERDMFLYNSAKEDIGPLVSFKSSTLYAWYIPYRAEVEELDLCPRNTPSKLIGYPSFKSL